MISLVQKLIQKLHCDGIEGLLCLQKVFWENLGMKSAEYQSLDFQQKQVTFSKRLQTYPSSVDAFLECWD